MKSNRILVLLMLGVLVAISSVAYGQRAEKVKKFLSKLQVGEWIEFEGIPQKDFSIFCEEIEAIYGEVEDDDWEISGMISSIYPDEKKVFLLNLPIIFDEKVEYEDDFNVIKSFSDLKAGMFIEVEGTLLKDGSFQALEVGQMEPKDVKLNRVEWTGKVQAVNPDALTIIVLGHTVQLTNETKIKSPVTD